MILRKPSGIFWLDIRVNGRRVRRSLGTTERALALERAADVAAGLRCPKPVGLPFAEFATRYLEWARQTKPGSYAAEKYRVDIIKAWLYKAGLSTLESITPYHVEQFRAWVLTKKIGDTAKHVGKSTANRYCALLRTMFNRARDWEIFDGPNPVSRVRFYREGRKVRPLTDTEVRAVLAAVDALATRKHATALQREAPALFRFILNTGLRRSEALGLRWVDVGDDVLTITGKGGKTRLTPLNAEARAIVGQRPRVGPFVFNIPGRTSPSLLRRLTATISKNAGVPFHLHLLRHYFATQLLRNGIDIVTISGILGHSATMTTLLYAHTSAGEMRRAVDTLPGHSAVDVSG